MKRFVFRNRWLPYALVAPQVAVTLAFFFWPAFDSLRLSLYRASPFGDRLIWAGFANFERLFRDPAYLRSALTSFVFSSFVTFVGLALALLLASLANAKIRGLGVYRSLLLWPYGIAPAIAGIIWLFIFHPSYGILPWLLSFVTAYQFNWFLKGWVAMVLIVVAAIWKQFGYNLAFYLAGLQAIETSVLEAASVDGAGPIRRFFAITFPLLSPVTFFLFTLNMTFSFFDTFGLIHSVTEGGPGDATSIMVYRAWKDGFDGLQLGLSAARAHVLATARLMAERAPRRVDWSGWTAHAILVVAVAMIAFPLYYALVISTQTLDQVTSLPPKLLPSTNLLQNYADAWGRAQMGRLLLNSAIVAVAVAVGKISISLLSAFAIAYFNFRGKQVIFWMIFVTLMLPIPVRIVSTYQVVSVLGWVDSYWGLTVPLMASATGTFLFRQFFQTIPDSLAEAAQLDGAGPVRFLWSILLPLSKANMAALFVILFVYGWNEYLWPLMITTTAEMRTAVVGIEALVPRGGSQLPEWNVIMAAAMMTLLPPVIVIVTMQRWFVKGLIETEK